MFQGLLGGIKSEVVQDLARVHLPTAEELAELEAQQQRDAESMQLSFQHSEVDGLTGEVHQDPELASINQAEQLRAAQQSNKMYANVSRNAPCPCGSGKKFKQCHGRLS